MCVCCLVSLLVSDEAKEKKRKSRAWTAAHLYTFATNPVLASACTQLVDAPLPDGGKPASLLLVTRARTANLSRTRPLESGDRRYLPVKPRGRLCCAPSNPSPRTIHRVSLLPWPPLCWLAGRQRRARHIPWTVIKQKADYRMHREKNSELFYKSD